MCVSAALTFQASGVKLNEELGSAGRLHDGLDALKLYVGLLRSLGQTWGTPQMRRKKQKPWVGHAVNSKFNSKGKGKTYRHTDKQIMKDLKDQETLRQKGRVISAMYLSWRQTETSPPPRRSRTLGSGHWSRCHPYSLTRHSGRI